MYTDAVLVVVAEALPEHHTMLSYASLSAVCMDMANA